MPLAPEPLRRHDRPDGQRPAGFLSYRGPTPGYTEVVLAYGKRLRLRVRRLWRQGDDLVVED